jgi:hypothetical protein
MNLGLLMALENADKVLSNIQPIFNTGPYGDPPLKIKISKIGLRHVLSWSKLGLEPKFHDPGTFGGFGKRGQTHTQTRFMFYKYRYILAVSPRHACG